jgi:Leucine-rich repeat (LRR) protein
MSDEQFVSVVDRLSRFPQRNLLEKLILDYNHISKIPDHFVGLSSQLTHLSIIKNHFSEFPVELCSISSLV